MLPKIVNLCCEQSIRWIDSIYIFNRPTTIKHYHHHQVIINQVIEVTGKQGMIFIEVQFPFDEILQLRFGETDSRQGLILAKGT